MSGDPIEQIDLTFFAQRLQAAMADMIHRDGQQFYGDVFYAEALRRAMEDRRCGVVTRAEMERATEQSRRTAAFNADQADRARREAAVQVAKAHEDQRDAHAAIIRGMVHSLSGKYRQEGARAAADWLAPKPTPRP